MTAGQGIWAVIPIKRLDQAKQRLAPAYAPARRQALVRAMLADMLDALAQVDGLIIAVATSDPAIAHIAARAGAAVFTDDADGGYTAAAMAASRRLVRDGCLGMMILPGDVPGIAPTEIKRLLDAHRGGRAFTIVPSRDGTGTNAILMTPPDAVPLAFGPGSFQRHCEAATRAGIMPVVLHLPGVGLDLDLPEDVAMFLRSPVQTHSRAALSADPVPLLGAAET